MARVRPDGPRFEADWLVVNCDAAGAVPVWISVGGGDFVPAYRDYYAGVRAAQIRHPPGGSGRTPVRLKVGEVITDAGTIDL